MRSRNALIILGLAATAAAASAQQPTNKQKAAAPTSRIAAKPSVNASPRATQVSAAAKANGPTVRADTAAKAAKKSTHRRRRHRTAMAAAAKHDTATATKRKP